MAKVVGDIAVEVGADVSPLQRALNRGGRDLDTFGNRAAAMGAKVAKVGGIVAAGLGAAAGASYAMARSAADAGAEIERMSQLASTTPERFQRMAVAAQSFGVEQEKLADILKDVQDRVGDFLATGGGPMADFFENIAPKVGVTAEQFKNLSGPQALQLYVDSLEKAGVGQEEMTFYLEAMASDLTQLLPLLTNGGAEMQRLGDEAEKAGRVLSNEAVAGSQELRRELDDLTAGIRTKLNEAILENKEEIQQLANDIETVWIPALINVAEAITTVINGIADATRAYKAWRDLIQSGDPGKNPTEGMGGMFEGIGGDGTGGGDPVSGGGGSMSADDAARLYGIGAGGGSGGEGQGGSGVLNFMADQGEVIEEQQLEHYARLGEILSDYNSDRFAMLSEAGERELELQQEYADRSRQIEEMAGKDKLRAAQGAFGDLASLMATENERLFKIGKAAAIAEATVSGYQAAVEAWEKGMKVGGPPVAAAFTAASLARTGALISNIASQNIGGGGGGSGAAGGGGGGEASAAGAGGVDRNLTIDVTGNVSPDADQIIKVVQQAIDDGWTIRGVNR